MKTTNRGDLCLRILKLCCAETAMQGYSLAASQTVLVHCSLRLLVLSHLKVLIIFGSNKNNYETCYPLLPSFHSAYLFFLSTPLLFLSFQKGEVFLRLLIALRRLQRNKHFLVTVQITTGCSYPALQLSWCSLPFCLFDCNHLLFQ